MRINNSPRNGVDGPAGSGQVARRQSQAATVAAWIAGTEAERAAYDSPCVGLIHVSHDRTEIKAIVEERKTSVIRRFEDGR